MLRLSFFGRFADTYQPTSIGGNEVNDSNIEDSVVSDGTEGVNLFEGAPKDDRIPCAKEEYQAFPSGSIVGIDFDGTLTLVPDGFKKIMEEIVANGGKCYIITARPRSDAGVVKDFCKKNGIAATETHFFPEEYTYEEYQSDPKTWDKKMGEWKSGVVKNLGVTVMIDDRDAYLNDIGSVNPDVVLLKPEEI